MLELTSDNFYKEVKQREGPIIVDFWAEWCGPCLQLAPVFEKIAPDYEGKLTFAKLDVPQGQDVAEQNGVMGLPTMLIFNKGVEVDRITGALPEEALRAKIDEILGKVE